MLTFQDLFDSSPIPMGIIQQGCFQLTSPKAYELTGYTTDELWGMPLEKVLHPDDRPQVLQSAKRRLTGEAVPEAYEFRMITKKGQVKYLLGYFHIVTYRDEKAILAQFVDRTEKKSLEDEIEKNWLIFKNMFQQSPTGIELYDQHGHLVIMNQACCNIFGISDQNDVVGIDLFSLIDLTDEMKDKLQRGEALQLSRTVDFDEIRRSNRYGTTNRGIRFLECRLAPLRAQSEGLLGYLLQIEDVTKRKAAEEQLYQAYSEMEQRVEERTAQLFAMNQQLQAEIQERIAIEESLRISKIYYRGIVDDQPDLIARYKPDGTLVFVNNAHCRFFGKSREELVGTNMYPLMAERHRETVRNIIASFDQDNEVHVMENEITRGDGMERWFHWTNRAIFDADGKVKEIQCVGRDLTERKQAEEKLQLANDGLERRVRERTRQLEKAKLTAEAALRAKSSFLANMSHELKTPLHGIIGMGEYLLEADLGEIEKNCVRSMLNSGHLLSKLINDVLDYSKFETERVQLRQIPFRLDKVLDETTKIIATMAVEKGLEFERSYALPDDPTYVGDPELLQQVLTSLLGNAVKFTDQGWVRLKCFIEAEQNAQTHWRFEVSDTGVGIAEENYDHIFELFVQGDNSLTRRFGGLGLGLALAKRLITLMGGQIGVSSKLGQGSIFWVSIPLLSCMDVTQQEVVPNREVKRGLTSGLPILLVEDSVATQKVIKAQLQKLGITNIDIANNGLEAIKAVAEKEYGLILMDCQMPMLDGYKATQAIRALESQKEGYTTIVAVTAHTTEQAQEMCYQAGMDGYIPKPFNYEVLIKFMNDEPEEHTEYYPQEL
ncbi:PAS domain S-box protein [Heliophilum fasciatum]|uniref:Circadian input-output histidine kinase CikA n=1 Tax=Heliophilum fasciatum TaxID=35700 RepID=A0A4R2RZE6_9FIRM|nr:PAS domain S-box protein [Heliophilum fasciatum]MCW2276985.1 PAS domain S-box-containing protein [Heliophilum fasciatum]TCP68489.1 PAS domain S-box-containing protein [Heliophilum fasciatum]